MTETLRTGLAAKFSLRAVSRTALGCLLGAALLSTGTPARAGDSDDVPIDTKIIRGVLEGLGLQRVEKDINYQERVRASFARQRAMQTLPQLLPSAPTRTQPANS